LKGDKGLTMQGSNPCPCFRFMLFVDVNKKVQIIKRRNTNADFNFYSIEGCRNLSDYIRSILDWIAY